jgi:hypothetical protein
MDDPDPTKASDVADPTKASNVAEGETESIHAWSQSDDAETEFVDHRGSRTRWVAVISALAVAVAAVSASLFFDDDHATSSAQCHSATTAPPGWTCPARTPAPVASPASGSWT